jgi:hypothetical protein
MTTAPSRPTIVRVTSTSELPEALRTHEIASDRAVLVCIGGAGGLSEQDRAALTELLGSHLILAIDRLGATIVDGGTDAGIMSAIGQVRAASGSSFQLIGVAAAGTVNQPDSAEQPPTDAAEIEPNHTHIVLVPGDAWGDETPWLSAVARSIAGEKPSATLVVNGGTISMNDALTSIGAERPVIVLGGSGRAADEIAGARSGAPANDAAKEVSASPLTTVVALSDPAAVVRAISDALMRSPAN